MEHIGQLQPQNILNDVLHIQSREANPHIVKEHFKGSVWIEPFQCFHDSRFPFGGWKYLARFNVA